MLIELCRGAISGLRPSQPTVFASLRHRSVRWAATALAGLVWLGSGGAAGCSDGPSSFVPVTSASASSGGGGQENIARELFDELAGEFVSECGVCHVIGGAADTPFLGDIDGTKEPGEVTAAERDKVYEAVTSWPSFIVKDAANSVLINWSTGPGHNGPPPKQALEDSLRDWLAEEAKAVKDVGENPVPTIPPFKPIVPGFNAVYLETLGADYAGMAVTFQAEELTTNSLSLTGIEVHPTTKKGLSFEHPLFTVFPLGSADGDPDPVDSFSNVMQEFQPGESGPLGPGTVVLTNWSPGGKLSIAFETISVIDPNGSGGGGAGGGMPGGACGALNSFVANAAPVLGNCTSCHGGNNQGATNAVDMSDLNSDPDAACGQIKNRVNLNTPNQSQLFITTDPQGNASHPFKFGGSTNNFNAFRNAVTIWISAEAQAQ